MSAFKKSLTNTISFYDKNAKSYADKTETKLKPEEIDEFSKLLIKDSLVLDVGCGSGRDTRPLADKGLRVVGIDLSKGLLKEARKRSPNLEYKLMDMRKLEFANQVFDGIYSNAAFHHLESTKDIKKTLKGFNRVLKPNGHLYIRVREQTKKIKSITQKDNRFYRYLTKTNLKNLVENAGFSTLKLYNTVKSTSGIFWIVIIAQKHA